MTPAGEATTESLKLSKGRHVQWSDVPGLCSYCEKQWPCPGSIAVAAYESARGDVSVAPEHWTPGERAAYDLGLTDGRNEKPCPRCPRCAGIGTHGLIHTRHGNGGGSNSPCPNATALVGDATEQGDRSEWSYKPEEINTQTTIEFVLWMATNPGQFGRSGMPHPGFREWLSAHDAEMRAEGWDTAHDKFCEESYARCQKYHMNPYRKET